MGTIQPPYRPLLDDFDYQQLEQHPDVVYAVDAQFQLCYMNPAWYRFAEENGGEPSIAREWPLGRSIIEAIAGPLRSFFLARLSRVLRSQESWEFMYQCPSPHLQRIFNVRVQPLPQAHGLLMTHTLVSSYDPEAPALDPVATLYRDRNGFFVQCCYCRRIARQDVAGQWDWVPHYIARPPSNTSHSICPGCLETVQEVFGDS